MNAPHFIPPWHRLPRGFTLLEVMLALGIFSMVLVSIYATWSALTKGARIAGDATAAVQRARMTVRAIEDALNTAQIYAGNPDKYWFEARKAGEFSALSLTARLPATFPGSGLYGEQRLRLVEFIVEEGPDSTRELHLYQKAVLAPDNEPPYRITLGRDVTLFKLEFWDPQKKDWVDEWLNRQTNSIPPLVRVSVGMGPRSRQFGDDRELVSRVIAPAAIVVPREYQIPGTAQPPTLPPGTPVRSGSGTVTPPVTPTPAPGLGFPGGIPGN
ncbi:MAG: prepilin-type N-terminal cleavage/methylation domain-containing protein [Verrucomicrobiae bacterium]|nr:prepilin-type N-terminal cleavage/methylation domain-containing protein [Verrucomicrobiae bacterium]